MYCIDDSFDSIQMIQIITDVLTTCCGLHQSAANKLKLVDNGKSAREVRTTVNLDLI